MRRIILITHTPKSWSGGVNRWVNDFIAGFPDAVHYSYFDLITYGVVTDEQAHGLHFEPDRARVLNAWLRQIGRVLKDDIIIVDGFWGLGLEDFPNVVSHSHGIWSHLLPWEVGQREPENAFLHAKQVDYRRKHLERGGRLTACSDFIAWSMKEQWGFESTVINNAVDLDEWKPHERVIRGQRQLVIHGVNDESNLNKGGDHVRLTRELVGPYADVLSLDQVAEQYELTKQEALALADVVVIPSGHEGNSYFCLETLACDVPIVAYSVGLPYAHYMSLYGDVASPKLIGKIIDRKNREPHATALAVEDQLENVRYWKDRGVDNHYKCREWVSQFSIQEFWKNWRQYLEKEFA